MKFSIQEEGKEKQIFFNIQRSKANKLESQSPTFGEFSKEKTKNSKGKMEKFFSFRKKRQNEPFLQVDGEDIFDYDELEKFGISSQCFLNQILKKKKHFLDSEEITHYITWKSPEFDFFIDTLRKKSNGCKNY